MSKKKTKLPLFFVLRETSAQKQAGTADKISNQIKSNQKKRSVCSCENDGEHQSNANTSTVHHFFPRGLRIATKHTRIHAPGSFGQPPSSQQAQGLLS